MAAEMSRNEWKADQVERAKAILAQAEVHQPLPIDRRRTVYRYLKDKFYPWHGDPVSMDYLSQDEVNRLLGQTLREYYSETGLSPRLN
jgi:hypothetical protein